MTSPTANGRRPIVGTGYVQNRRRSHRQALARAAPKRAHSDLIALKASPLSPSDEQRGAVAPATQYERQLGRLAFLAPELQRRILAGDQPRGVTLRAILKSEMPLAWADQTAWLERISRT